MRSRLFSSLLFLLLLAALPAAPADAALAKRGGEVSTADACNPHPDKDDIVLPMPGGLSMAFRLVAVPSKGLLWDMSARPGRDDAANSDRAFYDRRYRAFLSAPFSRARAMTSSPAQTSVSLLASAISLPASIAHMVGTRPENPTMAESTISVSLSAATAHKPFSPDKILQSVSATAACSDAAASASGTAA